MVRKSVTDRREDLIEATIRVMSRDGVAKATTRAIAAEAGASLSAFHYCFDSREQVLTLASERLADEMVEEARTAFAGGGSLRERIDGSLTAFWARVEEAPDRELVGYELSQYAMRSEKLSPLVQELFQHYLTAFEQFLLESAQAATITWTVPVPVLARFVNSTLDGLALCWLVDRDSDAARRVLDALVDYLLGCAQQEH